MKTAGEFSLGADYVNYLLHVIKGFRDLLETQQEVCECGAGEDLLEEIKDAETLE